MATWTLGDCALLTARGRVMTPRPATERLVVAAAERIGTRRMRVADVGTGSGVVAVSLARLAPGAEIWASDTSPAAVALARANADRHCVAARVHVPKGDLLEPFTGSFDVIVANLPYLPDADRARYPDLADDPSDAVFAPGDGLGLYRRLLRSAEQRLRPGGAAVIQLHRRVLVAEQSGLPAFRARLHEFVPGRSVRAWAPGSTRVESAA
ncbi:MAG: methyltransferase [Actinobacteria bacterium]|nr:MAG: methyltransferase [Actinomycetota bacterium]